MLFTPGPTTLPDAVRDAMSRPIQNPDIDPAFAAFYRDLTEKLKSLYGTNDDVVTLGGEGILGLDAAVANTVQSGDDVLCVSNGLYGDYFADFVERYGGNPTVVGTDYKTAIDVDAVETALESTDFVAATFVHCETPTGTLNDLDALLEACREHDVLTIVDAVSSFAGTTVPVDHVDFCIAGSQKCLSSPPGLATIAVSDAAWDRVMETDTASYYADLEPWKTQWLDNDWFPYTHLVSNLYALDASVDLVLEEGLDVVYDRHERVATHCRERGREIGLETFADDSLSSPTVTAFSVPGDAKRIQRAVNDDHDILLATGLADLETDVIRVGHMGYNATIENVDAAMDALEVVVS